jgi:hypothetical protein
MVEIPDRPGAGVVTKFTARAENLLVPVIFFMAGEAIPGGIFVTRGFMATLAGDRNMASRQREARHAMVKSCDFPRVVAVTLFTLVTQLVFVFVVFFVA